LIRSFHFRNRGILMHLLMLLGERLVVVETVVCTPLGSATEVKASLVLVAVTVVPVLQVYLPTN